jgi:hypothetical protein
MRWSSLIGNISDRKGFFLSFILGFVIRLIPEVLSYPYPIGFDTVYYAARIKSGVIWSSWTSIFSMWLLEGVLISMNQIVIDPFLLLKLAVPLIYALNVCGIYYFSRKVLNWRVKMALIAAFFFAFQLASLRLSWDLHRNLLGSAVLLFTLPSIRRVETKKNFATLLMLSLLLVLTHTFVWAILFAVILATLIGDWLKHERLKSLKLLAAVLPAFAVLLTSFFVFPLAPYAPSNVIVSDDTVHQRPGGLFFLVNYLSVSDAFQNYPTYLDLTLHVFSLFSVLYLWWLPLVLVGFFRDRTLDGLTLLFLFGSFNALITPFCALDLWNRWMFMLVYPFTFYAINGVKKLSKLGGKSIVPGFMCLNWMRVTRKTVLGIFSATIVLGSIFLTLPPFFDRFGVFSIPTTMSYFPSTMLYNTVPLRDVKSTIKVMEWLNEHMNSSSSLLIHHAFLWWADLYLDKKHMIIYFVKDTERALNVALKRGFNPIYLLWWNENYLSWQNESIGWYGITIPKYFNCSFSSDRISVFRYSTV